jgi:hypothetical protein
MMTTGNIFQDPHVLKQRSAEVAEKIEEVFFSQSGASFANSLNCFVKLNVR